MARNASETTVLCLDIDDTLWKNTEFGYTTDANGKKVEKDKPLALNLNYSEDLFVPHLASFLRSMHAQGITICLTTQSSGKYGIVPLLNRFLRDNNLEHTISSVASLDDLASVHNNQMGKRYPISTIPLISKQKEELAILRPGDFSGDSLLHNYGKGSSAELASIAMEKAGITDYQHVRVITIGDHPGDLQFAMRVKEKLAVSSVCAIHANVIPLGDKRLNAVKKQMEELKKSNIPSAQAHSLREVGNLASAFARDGKFCTRESPF